MWGIYGILNSSFRTGQQPSAIGCSRILVLFVKNKGYNVVSQCCRVSRCSKSRLICSSAVWQYSIIIQLNYRCICRMCVHKKLSRIHKAALWIFWIQVQANDPTCCNSNSIKLALLADMSDVHTKILSSLSRTTVKSYVQQQPWTRRQWS